MKHSVVLFLLAILVHQECCFHVSVEAGDGFVTTRGIHFLLNGNPYYANGFNAYWLIYTTSNPSQRFKVSNAFREATSHGITVGITWEIEFRTDNEPLKGEMKLFTAKIVDMMKQENLYASQGAPIILSQGKRLGFRKLFMKCQTH